MDLDSQSDEKLLESFLGGHQRAFELLVRRHEDRVFALACRMMGDRSEALDATQETFLALYRRAGSFRGESAFSTWLYRVGINTCRDLLRKRKRDPRPEENLHETAGAAHIDEQAALRIDVSSALAALPEEYREAVAMHDLGGVPYEEIARLVEVPIGTVKSRISRGRRLLAQSLEHPGRGEASKSRGGGAQPLRTCPSTPTEGR